MSKRKGNRKAPGPGAAGAGGDGGGEPGRFSARRKTDAILRLLRASRSTRWRASWA